jgi:OOP family OmpA-OmpF porin
MLEVWKGLSGVIKTVIIVVLLVTVGGAAMHFGLIPGLRSAKSQEVTKYSSTNDVISSRDATTGMLPVPKASDAEIADGDSLKAIRQMDWVWFGTAGVYTANGGLNTVKGSLMEHYGINLTIKTDNSTDDMKREQLLFIEKYAKGDNNPTGGIHFVALMGDGYPAYVSAMNATIQKAYGKEYCLKAIGAVGFSQGEDCIMGPANWKDNPANMKGAVISAVIGDGDWGIAVRFAADNGLKVNPDPTSYDPNAVNFVPAPGDNFMEAAKDVVSGKHVSLKIKDANGNLTGKTASYAIQGAATWFPGDRLMTKNTNTVKIISTKEYSNQMACVIVGCDKWMKENSKTVTNYLSAVLTASNQIKNQDQWFKYACDLSPKVFCADPSSCEESAEDWYTYAKPGGTETTNTDGDKVSVGGTLMANLADNKKYFGLKTGTNNYYKSVYEYFSGVLKTLNPGGFMDNVKGLTSYEDAVDFTYLNKVTIDLKDAGSTTKIDYSQNKGRVFADRNWHLEFATASDQINGASDAELKQIFDALNIAGTAKVKIVGHTDNTGTPDGNKELSEARARSVKKWLIDHSKGAYPSERFVIEGKGQDEPVADNTTASGKAKNRRVEIQLMQ